MHKFKLTSESFAAAGCIPEISPRNCVAAEAQIASHFPANLRSLYRTLTAYGKMASMRVLRNC